MLRPYWARRFPYDVPFGIFLVCLLGIPRFIMVLHANISRKYGLVSVIFICKCLAPFIFLSGSGRKKIGMTLPGRWHWIPIAFVSGMLCCAVLFWLAESLYGKGPENCFVYISRTYRQYEMNLSANNRLLFFLIYAGVGMSFSPFGEELFYRGLDHGSFVARMGENKASIADSAAFAITHLAHFGIVYISGQWQFFIIPAMVWMTGMFLASRLFFYLKQKTGSLAGAVAGHAGFNFAMTYFIFYHIF